MEKPKKLEAADQTRDRVRLRNVECVEFENNISFLIFYNFLIAYLICVPELS